MKGKLVICPICSTEFYVSPSRLKKNKIHTCSKKCLGIFNKNRFSKKVETECSICRNKIYIKPSHFRGHNLHTCSRTCSAKRNSLLYKGEGNPRALHLTKIEKYFWEKAKDIKAKSAKLNWDCDIDYKFLIELYNKQKGLCYYSELPIQPIKKRKGYDTLSIDRIDSSKYYTKDNIVMCALCLNYLKSNFNMTEVKKVFDAISLKNKIVVHTKIKIKEKQYLPFKHYKEDAGYDLFASKIEDLGHVLKVETGISLQPDGNFYFEIFNRSSNYKKGIYLVNNVAVIDRNYIGEIVLFFYKDSSYKEGNVKVGDRVAQLIAQQQIYVEFEEVNELSETERGTGGYGSTNK